MEEEASRRVATEEITEARADRMVSDAATARDVLAFVEGLAREVKPPNDDSHWQEFCAWARRILEGYLVNLLPESEELARDKVLRVLEELGAADSVGRGATTLDEFRQAVEDSLRTNVGHLGVTGQGVFVSSVAVAAGMSFDMVWLLGMVEGGMPPAIRPDPLLSEADWQAAGGQSRVAQRIAVERYDYLSALATAPHRELSYPVANAASQRQAYPSRWFLEQASSLEGAPVHASGLGHLGGREWLSVDYSPEHALSSTPEAALSDTLDYNLSRLLLWRRSGLSLGDHPFAREGNLLSAVSLARSRGFDRLTEFDGNLSAVSGGGAVPA